MDMKYYIIKLCRSSSVFQFQF